ncbi:MAG: hypothetical protein JRI52_06460, partial [Deltaproteobacteria bacterium]|nr:hypothetical protein [Deltaproteobacteria bacterium]
APGVLAILEKAHRERDFFGTRFNVYSGLCAHYGYALGMLGKFEEGKPWFKRGFDFAFEVGALYGLGLLEFFYGLSFSFAGDGKNAVDHLEKSTKYFEDVQSVLTSGFAWGGLGYGYYLLGGLETAQNYIEKGISIIKDRQISVFLSMHLLHLAMVHFESGDLKKAQDRIEEAVKLSQKTGERHWQAYSRTWQGRILGKDEASRAGEAEEYILQGIKICNELKIKPFSAQGYLFLGELYTETGQREKALENLKKAEEMFQEMGMDYWLTKTQEVLARL